jgi:xylan 1,4-beta-xylosidase
MGWAASVIFALAAATTATAIPLQYVVDVSNKTDPWTKYFLESVGSGHAGLALRADYQQQLQAVKSAIDFKRVRAHGIFIDDLSVVLPAYNNTGLGFYFYNAFQIYDSWLAMGIRPIVELSFMPGLLASGNATWAHFNARIDPPKNWSDWSSLISAFASALIDRYGIDEVATWNFEVWNEPNCCGPNTIPPFWTGGLNGYLQLYNTTAVALKAVDKRLRVGGPASSATGWIDEILAFVKEGNVPLDFVSTHIYPTVSCKG